MYKKDSALKKAFLSLLEYFDLNQLSTLNKEHTLDLEIYNESIVSQTSTIDLGIWYDSDMTSPLLVLNADQLSLLTFLPTAFQIAAIIDYENLNNFHPISNLLFLAKTLEGIVAAELISHLIEKSFWALAIWLP